jgi:ABC-type transport system substrate-binding protein
MNRIARIFVCAAIAAFVAGCSTNTSATTSGGAGAPHYVPGTLRIADIKEPDTMNPYISSSITSIDLA